MAKNIKRIKLPGVIEPYNVIDATAIHKTDVATSTKAGIVKIGSGITVAADGTISVNVTSPVTSVNGQTGDVELNDIKYTAQALTSEQKSQARVNIGAGTSNFDGDYNSLTNRPTVTKVILKTWTESDMS